MYLSERALEASRLPRNLDSKLHPFQGAREYTKALNAVKLERMFAKPFIGQLGKGHVDAVYTISPNSHVLNSIASGSGDGVIKYWSLTSQTQIQSIQAHESIIKSLSVTPTGKILSCASDKTIKLWNMANANTEPEQIYLGEAGFNCIDHQRGYTNTFASGSTKVQVWDISRSSPLSSLSWGADTIMALKFAPSEHSLFASSGSDRALILYDLRTTSPIQKLITTMNSNALCWNPQNPHTFAAASEDHNIYIYDIRRMDISINVLKDHVASVMDIDYSPTGKEIVSASYDRTIRIFNIHEGHSRDIYHTKRMQRVFSAKFTLDNKYIISGSDDGNVRLWRAKASERPGIKSSRERVSREYTDTLKQRFKYMPEIRSITRHRHLPSAIKKAKEIKRIETDALKRRQMNERKHSKAKLPFVPERKRHIVGVAIKDNKTTAISNNN